jgi:hypothetical protein
MEPWRAPDAHNGGVGNMESRRVCRRLVGDSHHFNEEQDPDADPHP